jgi:hypothetical protein
MKSCIFRAAAIAVAFAAGVAAPGSVVFAQGGQGQGGQGGAAASKSVPGVTVQPQKRETPPTARKKALDAEAAKRRTWQAYRNAPTPATAPGAANPGMSAAAMAGNYPGLHDAAAH